MGVALPCPMPYNTFMAKEGELLERLLEVMRLLRERCPWDRRQSPQSLRPYLLEEAYEALEALDAQEPQRLKEELGDLLLQIVFQCQLAQEQGHFGMAEVLEGIVQKMLRRHPHVFGTEELRSAQEVYTRWMEHKRREGKLRRSLMEGIPKALPALLRALKVQRRASRVGLDWEAPQEVRGKLLEELRELDQAKGPEEVQEELGDVLFSLVNLCRFLQVEPEGALQKATEKFIRRFQWMEAQAERQGRRLQELSPQELDALWSQAKEASP